MGLCIRHHQPISPPAEGRTSEMLLAVCFRGCVSDITNPSVLMLKAEPLKCCLLYAYGAVYQTSPTHQSSCWRQNLWNAACCMLMGLCIRHPQPISPPAEGRTSEMLLAVCLWGCVSDIPNPSVLLLKAEPLKCCLLYAYGAVYQTSPTHQSSCWRQNLWNAACCMLMGLCIRHHQPISPHAEGRTSEMLLAVCLWGCVSDITNPSVLMLKAEPLKCCLLYAYGAVYQTSPTHQSSCWRQNLWNAACCMLMGLCIRHHQPISPHAEGRTSEMLLAVCLWGCVSDITNPSVLMLKAEPLKCCLLYAYGAVYQTSPTHQSSCWRQNLWNAACCMLMGLCIRHHQPISPHAEGRTSEMLLAVCLWGCVSDITNPSVLMLKAEPLKCCLLYALGAVYQTSPTHQSSCWRQNLWNAACCMLMGLCIRHHQPISPHAEGRTSEMLLAVCLWGCVSDITNPSVLMLKAEPLKCCLLYAYGAVYQTSPTHQSSCWRQNLWNAACCMLMGLCIRHHQPISPHAEGRTSEMLLAVCLWGCVSDITNPSVLMLKAEPLKCCLLYAYGAVYQTSPTHQSSCWRQNLWNAACCMLMGLCIRHHQPISPHAEGRTSEMLLAVCLWGCVSDITNPSVLMLKAEPLKCCLLYAYGAVYQTSPTHQSSCWRQNLWNAACCMLMGLCIRHHQPISPHAEGRTSEMLLAVCLWGCVSDITNPSVLMLKAEPLKCCLLYAYGAVYQTSPTHQSSCWRQNLWNAACCMLMGLCIRHHQPISPHAEGRTSEMLLAVCFRGCVSDIPNPSVLMLKAEPLKCCLLYAYGAVYQTSPTHQSSCWRQNLWNAACCMLMGLCIRHHQPISPHAEGRTSEMLLAVCLWGCVSDITNPSVLMLKAEPLKCCLLYAYGAVYQTSPTHQSSCWRQNLWNAACCMLMGLCIRHHQPISPPAEGRTSEMLLAVCLWGCVSDITNPSVLMLKAEPLKCCLLYAYGAVYQTSPTHQSSCWRQNLWNAACCMLMGLCIRHHQPISPPAEGRTSEMLLAVCLWGCVSDITNPSVLMLKAEPLKCCLLYAYGAVYQTSPTHQSSCWRQNLWNAACCMLMGLCIRHHQPISPPAESRTSEMLLAVCLWGCVSDITNPSVLQLKAEPLKCCLLYAYGAVYQTSPTHQSSSWKQNLWNAACYMLMGLCIRHHQPISPPAEGRTSEMLLAVCFRGCVSDIPNPSVLMLKAEPLKCCLLYAYGAVYQTSPTHQSSCWRQNLWNAACCMLMGLCIRHHQPISPHAEGRTSEMLLAVCLWGCVTVSPHLFRGW